MRNTPGPRLACRLLLPVLLLIGSPSVPAEPYSADDVKAAMVFRLLHYVEWPGNNSESGLEICLDASVRNPEGYRLLEGRQVGRRVLHVRRCASGACPASCAVRLVEGRAGDAKAGELIIALDDQREAMMALAEDQGKVRLRGRPAAWRHAGLKVSARLMRVMQLSDTRGEGG